ncbi:hypothetical protein ACHAP5_006671 [Fusarium lateritium]
MEMLHSLLSLQPDLRHHCKSLFLIYKEKDSLYSHSSGIGNEGQNEDETEEITGENPEMDVTFPRTGILNDIYTWLFNVTDFQVHVHGFAKEMPNFSFALSSMPKLAVLRITGFVNYLLILKQLVAIRPDSMPRTLDLSTAISNGWDYVESDRQEACQTIPNAIGTGSVTRLLTGAGLDVDVLTALVAWPRRLERLALQVDPNCITGHSADRGSLQNVLDSQKKSLTHLRIEGKYELGLHGFDLRDFSRLEQLALCTATMSNFNQFPRDKTIMPELDCRIFAPNLRSLLWVLPWWLDTKSKVKDFFAKKHEKRMRLFLEMAIKLRERKDIAYAGHFARVWVQSTADPPERFERKAQRNFEKGLRHINALDDEFRSLGIRIKHLPLPKPRSDVKATKHTIFGPLEEVWSWDKST